MRGGILGLAVLLVVSAFVVPTAVNRPAPANLPFVPHAPILIQGDAGFTAASGVIGGHGTPADPYLISGWTINGSGNNAIEVRHTSSSFVISNVEVHDATGVQDGVYLLRDGIYLFDVANAVIRDVHAWANWHGVWLNSVTNVTVRANNLTGNGHGLQTWFANDTRILNNSVTANGNGILITSMSSNVLVEGNSIEANAFDGVEVASSVGPVLVSNNTLRGNGEGILTGWESRANLSGNVLVGNSGGISVQSDANVTVRGNVIGESPWGGLVLADSQAVLVSGNRFSRSGIMLAGEALPDFDSHEIAADNLVDGRPILYAKDCVGLTLDGAAVGQVLVANCTGVRITGLALGSTGVGVQVAFSRAVAVEASTVASALYGILVQNTTGVLLRDDSVVGSRSVGLALHASQDLSIIGNEVRATLGSSGLDLEGVSNASVSGNRIALGAGNGVDIVGSDGVDVTGNTFSGNANYGLRASLTVSLRVSMNNFVWNGWSPQGLDVSGSGNAWDSGYPAGGNFWTDYAGVDRCTGVNQDACTGPDGLGDSGYSVGMGTVDRYPRMTPDNLTLPLARFVLTPSAGNASSVFRVDASASSGSPESTSTLLYRWDWESDGVWDTNWSSNPAASHVFGRGGNLGDERIPITLEVADSLGILGRATRSARVDASPPTVELYAPTAAFAGDPLQVSAILTDPSGNDVLAAILYWRSAGNATFRSVPMLESSPGIFEAEVQAASSAFVQFYVVGYDAVGNLQRAPSTGLWTVAIMPRGWAMDPWPVVGIAIPIAAALTVTAVYLWRRRRRAGNP